MFGAVIYLPLFMQGVLGTSATQSGNLLTPLLIGAVVGMIVGGQTVSRTGSYKVIAVAGSVIIAIGMVLFARMGDDTVRSYVVMAMVVAGVGMGLLQPVYTIAVQNVAPISRMGAATSSTIFFRSIGSTVGVAAFGSIMLTRYHEQFAASVPAGVPQAALPYFSNPLLLMQMRPQLEQMFGSMPGGLQVMQTLLLSVKTSLSHALEGIFFWSAVIMCASVVLHIILKGVPLRGRVKAAEAVDDAASAVAIH